jgi:hypothetical protein
LLTLNVSESGATGLRVSAPLNRLAKRTCAEDPATGIADAGQFEAALRAALQGRMRWIVIGVLLLAALLLAWLASALVSQSP